MVDDDLARVAPWGFDPEQVCAPVLFLHGGQDRVAPSSHAKWLAGRIPSAELWLRPDDGHVSVLNSAATPRQKAPFSEPDFIAVPLRRCTYMRLEGTWKAAWTRSRGCGLPVVSYSYGCTTSLPCRQAWGIPAWQDHDRRLPPQQHPPGRPGSPLVGRPRATNRHPAGRPGRAGKWRPRRPWPSRIPSMRSPGK
jgi:hypothetical protein